MLVLHQDFAHGGAMQNLILALALLTTLSVVGAEPSSGGRASPSGSGGGEFVFHDVVHLTDSQREEIWAAIRENIRKLGEEGRLPATTLAHPLLAWPLRASPALTDPGYHGTGNFVDQNLSFPDQILDYSCGNRTYDLATGYNHQGIDFFTWPFAFRKMDYDEVEIVAAAPGVIIYKAGANYDRMCAFGGNWNAVYVRHFDGSIAWYGHMKRNSLTTKIVGAQVAQGEFLGIVGSSGNSYGPHLHFEVYDSSGAVNEPYQGPCNSMNPDSWWQAQRPYWDSALNHIGTGFAPPDFGVCPSQESPNESDSFSFGDAVYFTSYYRDQASGQVSQYAIYDPNGQLYSSWSHSISGSPYPASYWYWYFNSFAPNGPAGAWRFDVTYLGQTHSRSFTMSAAVPSGRVPDRDGTPEPPLRVERGPGPAVNLTWGASCLPSDSDYEVYEGALGNYYSHEYQLCSTGGATNATFIPYNSSSYFLVVPTNGVREGSYGRNSFGGERPPGFATCDRPQLVGGCP